MFRSRILSSSSNRMSRVAKPRAFCTVFGRSHLSVLGYCLTSSAVIINVINCVTKASSSQDCWTWSCKTWGLNAAPFFFFPSVIPRWLEKDTSTSLFVTLKRFSPWLFPTTSAPYWRLTWSATSMRRTLCLCPTLMRAWSTCRTEAAATPTPITKAMSINSRDTEGAFLPPLSFSSFPRPRGKLNRLQFVF